MDNSVVNPLLKQCQGPVNVLLKQVHQSYECNANVDWFT